MSSCFTKKEKQIYSQMLQKNNHTTLEIYNRMKENYNNKRMLTSASNCISTAASLPNYSNNNNNGVSYRVSSINTRNGSKIPLTQNLKKSNANSSLTTHRNKSLTNLTNQPNQKYKRNRYEDYLNMHYCGKGPLGLTEKRFKWQDKTDTSNMVEQTNGRNRKHRIQMDSYFKSGFAGFYGKEDPKKEKIQRKRLNYSAEGSVINYSQYQFGLKSKRVVNPELNDDCADIKHLNKRRKRNSCFGRLFNASTGSYTSLLERTPETFNFHGKKINLEKSIYKSSINIFSESYANDFVKPKNTRKRCSIIRLVNYFDHLNKNLTVNENRSMDDLRKKNYKMFCTYGMNKVNKQRGSYYMKRGTLNYKRNSVLDRENVKANNRNNRNTKSKIMPNMNEVFANKNYKFDKNFKGLANKNKLNNGNIDHKNNKYSVTTVDDINDYDYKHIIY